VSLPVTGVSELVLEVADLEAAERFYAEALGLPVVERWPDREAIWLMAGGRTRIGLWRPQTGAAGGRGGAHVHFALHLPEREFDSAVERLRRLELHPEVTSRGSRGANGNRSAYVFDPDDNCVELWTQDVAVYLRRVQGRPLLSEEAGSPAHFDATASEWDASYEERSLRAHRRRSRLDLVVRLVGDGPGSLLEVGLGSGRLFERLADLGWTVTGIDAAPGMVDLARARVPEAADRISVARAEELPFSAESFDVVVAIGVLEYTAIDAAVHELARVLRPGGRAVVGLRARSAPTVVWQRDVVVPVARVVKRVVPVGRPLPKRRRRPLRLRAARDLLATAGLAVERVEHVGATVLPDPLDRLAPRLAYRAARGAESSRRLRRIFGAQRVIVARKR
jgi:SAM-dependent methyltransferase/extradiol dioxygenase family protein